MISKAAYYMQDHIRRNYALLSDIAPPTVFMARGRQHFPQGLHAIAKIFGGRLPAHVYAHRYFMEKQSDPSQPSPQLHITEESQGILKVMGGMRYMRDSSSKLDGTLVVMTDYQRMVKGRMLCVHEDDLAAATNTSMNASSSSYAHQHHQQQQKMKRGGRFERGAKRSSSYGGASAGIGVGGGGFQGAMSASHGKDLGNAAHEPPVFPSPDDADDGSGGSMVDPARSYRFFHVSLYPRAAPISLKDDAAFQPVFQEKEGGYTVLYNPVELNDKTFADLLHKLHAEERVVAAIVLPTAHAWRHAQLWADAFPDAVILSSVPVPVEGSDPKSTSSGPASSAASATMEQSRTLAVVGGCQDMGDGVTGLVFPEVDEEELRAEQQQAQEASSGESPLTDAGVSQPPPSGSAAFSSTIPFTSSLGNMEKEDEFVDSILLSPGEMYLKQFVGLRQEDSKRVQVLAPPPLPDKGSPADSVLHGAIALTPSLELYYIHGDPIAKEYVLYDRDTQTLACSELYHGEYSDLDPVNSWMCRVWFKFMKRGNHKRTDRVPRDKWLAVRHGKGASLELLRETIDRLTRTLPIRLVVFSHGTPPLAMDPANALRFQWGLSPLHAAELPISVPVPQSQNAETEENISK